MRWSFHYQDIVIFRCSNQLSFSVLRDFLLQWKMLHAQSIIKNQLTPSVCDVKLKVVYKASMLWEDDNNNNRYKVWHKWLHEPHYGANKMCRVESTALYVEIGTPWIFIIHLITIGSDFERCWCFCFFFVVAPKKTHSWKMYRENRQLNWMVENKKLKSCLKFVENVRNNFQFSVRQVLCEWDREREREQKRRNEQVEIR